MKRYLLIIILSVLFLSFLIYLNNRPYQEISDHKVIFSEVSKEAGLDLNISSNGVIFVDVNNDGWDDLFVSSIYCKDNDCMENMNGNKLYKNLGNRKFEEVSKIVDLEDGGWDGMRNFLIMIMIKI